MTWGLAVAILLSQGLAQGAEPTREVERLIQERRTFMTELGATLRAAWGKFDGGDLATLDREAERIRDAASRMAGFFPPGSFGPESRARPSISERQEEFRRLSAELRAAAEEWLRRAGTRDETVIRTQLLQVGSACRACHKIFVEHPR